MCTFSYTLNLNWNVFVPFRNVFPGDVCGRLVTAQCMENGNHDNLGPDMEVYYYLGKTLTNRERDGCIPPNKLKKALRDIAGDTSIISMSFTKYTAPEIHSNIFFSCYFFFLEKASESNKDPGDLHHCLHPGRLHCLCDHSCIYLQIHRGMDSLGVHLLCSCYSDHCWLR